MVNGESFFGAIILKGLPVCGLMIDSHTPHLIQHPFSASTASHSASTLARERNLSLALFPVADMAVGSRCSEFKADRSAIVDIEEWIIVLLWLLLSRAISYLEKAGDDGWRGERGRERARGCERPRG